MTNTKNVTIGLLTVTAVILSLLLVGVHLDNRAYATSASVKGGGYVMVPGQVSNDIDAVYVINVAERRMHAYAYNRNTRTVEMSEPFDLARVFGQ